MTQDIFMLTWETYFHIKSQLYPALTIVCITFCICCLETFLQTACSSVLDITICMHAVLTGSHFLSNFNRCIIMNHTKSEWNALDLFGCTRIYSVQCCLGMWWCGVSLVLGMPKLVIEWAYISQMKHQLDATLCRFYFCRVTLHV